ncbi:MAG: GAF domain-containing protein [Balneolaceae bacterium]|nr:GAF domain-containing protein [Balneolaceae bacterium]
MNTAEITLSDTLLPDVKNILSRDKSRDEKLFAVCELLADNIPTFNWVGFYLADPKGKEELVLGPFVGEPTNHKRIPYGKGICGQVALNSETYISQDVHSEDNYLACSMDVQSEVVVPILKEESFVAQLDIDSHTKNSITKEQQELLEEICNLVAEEF